MSTEDTAQDPASPQEAPPTDSVGNQPSPGRSKNEFGLTDKEEAFAVWVVQENNRSLAYRRAYKPSVNTKPGTIWSAAADVAQRPHVARRINALRESAAAESVANKATLIKFLWGRILADRREVVNYKAYNCRHCHGEHGFYQWKDANEFQQALQAWTFACDPDTGSNPKPMPDNSGGYGFNPHAAPNPGCEHAACMGDGIGRTVIADTQSLTGAAADIYEGMKETAQGIEVKLADRGADIALLAKLLGWSIDRVKGAADEGAKSGGALPAEAYDIPSTATPEEASRRYLALVSS